MFRLCILMGCFVWASALAQGTPVGKMMPSSASHGKDAFSQAIAAGDIARIGEVLDSGISVNRSVVRHFAEGYTVTLTPLAEAMFRYVGGFPEDEKKGVEVVQYLISRGADINAAIPETGQTPLHLAAGALEGCIAFRLFAILREAGADVSARDNKGQTPLDVLRETLEDW